MVQNPMEIPRKKVPSKASTSVPPVEVAVVPGDALRVVPHGREQAIPPRQVAVRWLGVMATASTDGAPQVIAGLAGYGTTLID